MGINRWSDIEERKRNETDAKAGDKVPEEEEEEEKKRNTSSRLQASEEPAADKAKREVVEKLQERES